MASFSSLLQSTNSGSTGNAASPTLAFGSNTTSGSLLIIGVAGFQSPVTSVSSVTDTQGNKWERAFRGSGPNTRIAEVWYAQKCKGGADTVTVNWSASTFGVLCVAEIAVDAGWDVQVEAGATQENLAVTAHGSGNTAALLAPADLVIGCYADAGANTAISVAGGYTQATNFSPSASLQGALEYILSGTAAVQAGSFTTAVATTSQVTVAAFRFVPVRKFPAALGPRRRKLGLAPLKDAAFLAAAVSSVAPPPGTDPGTTIAYGYGSN